MGKFADSVRDGRVKAPQQKGFKLLNWEEEFKNAGPHDNQDRKLFDSGVWFASEFDQVRKITNQAIARFHWSSARDRSLAFVGYATREWMVLGKYIVDQINRAGGAGYFPSELDSVPVQSPFHNQVDAAGSIETLVDGLRYPLSLEFQETSKAAPRGAGSNKDLKAFMALVWMGQHYHSIEQKWLDCIWNGFHVNISDEIVIIEPVDSAKSRKDAVSKFRRQSIAFEAAHRAGLFWQHQIKAEAKRDFLARRMVLSVFKRNGRFRVKAAEAIRFEDRMSAVPVLKIMLTPKHAEPLLNRKLSSFQNLTLSQMLDAYELVGQIPEQVATHLPKAGGFDRPEDLLSWPPVFEKVEVVKAFAQALSIHTVQAECLVRLMTHSCSVRDQLWFRPFVQLNEEELTIVLPAVHGVNFARLLDWLLARDQEVEKELGPLFERITFADLKNEFSKSPIRSVVGISKSHGIRVRVAKAEEEIDLAFSVGHKVFVCELKSTQFPTEPIEHLNYQKRLDEASEQAARKAAFVTTNLEITLDQLGLKPTDDSIRPVVYPLIISSSALFAGWTWNNVPVCDWLILRRFFAEGKLELLGHHKGQGEMVHTVTQPFYSSAAEAVDLVERYFEHAPQVKLFEAFLRLQKSPLPVLGEGEKPKAVQNYAVQLPHETLRKIMQTP